MAANPPNDMVWDGWPEPLVVPKRWDLLGVTLYWVAVCPYGTG